MGKLIYRSRKRGKKVGATDSQSPSGASRADVEVWTMDEHRLGLKPVLQDVGSRREQPIAQVNWRFQWLWLYGFVHPQSGETYGGFCPKLISTCSIGYWQTLPNILPWQEKQIILAMDQAGWHTSSQVPRVIHLGSCLPFTRTSTSRASGL